MHSSPALILCQGICQLDIGSRTRSVRGGKAGAWSSLPPQLPTNPPKQPGSASIARPFTDSVRAAWLGDTERVSRVVAHLVGCQQTGRGAWREAEEGREEVTLWENGQALSKKCCSMHPTSQQQCTLWWNCPTNTATDRTPITSQTTR